MVKVTKFDATGKASGEYELDSVVFAGPVRKQIVQEVLLMQLAHRRSARPKCKGVGDVAGGGSKPYRQKGTGRARMGSMRSPLRRGGGVSLGPDGRANYKQRLPRKIRRAAIRSILSSCVKMNRLFVVEDINYDAPKTKTAVTLLNTLNFGVSTKVLFVIPEKNFNFEKSVSNVPKTKAILSSNLNPHDLLNFDQIVFFEGSVQKVTGVLA
jgi:large subunit ribosomal protein L4